MLTLLHTYVVVYELRNFSQAAKILYISQPTVSVHIQKLEEMTQIKLFVRNEKKGVEPTEFGDVFYEKALVMINEWEETIEELQQKKRERQQIKILISHSIAELYFNDFIPKLIITFPQLDFSFFIKNSEEIIHTVTQSDEVIGLIEKPNNRLDLKESVIIKDEMIHVGQTNSPYWIMREINSGVRYYQDVYLDNNEISANKIVTNNLSFIFKLLKSNIGQTIVSKKALEYLPQLDWQPTNLWRNLIMIQKKMHVENSLNEEIAAFLAAEFKSAEIHRLIGLENIEGS